MTEDRQILARKCHGHDGHHNNEGDGPQKKGNAVDDHRQEGVLLVKVNDAFHRVWFGVSIGLNPYSKLAS
jgi:hypothetical protein